MENKLKTLKDLECLNPTHDHKTRGDFCIIRKDELRAEAVKWVKQKRRFFPWFRRTDGEDFMDFFNLTEEDLK